MPRRATWRWSGKAAGEGSWQAAAWRLERKFPERWGRREHHELDANIKTTVKVTADDAVARAHSPPCCRAVPGGTGDDS